MAKLWAGWLIGSALVAAASQVVDAKTRTVEELTPILPWHVDWPKSSCGLRRFFGSVEEPFFIQFERFEPGDEFQLLLTGKRLRGLSPPQRLSIEYGQGGAAHEDEHYETGAAKDGTPTIFITTSSLGGHPFDPSNRTRVTPEMEAAINRIAISWGNRQIVLNTGSLGRAFAEVRKCTNQLVESWGLDPVQQLNRSRAPMPMGNPGNWMTSDDYPKDALASGTQALINFRLTVGVNGRATACEVQSSYSGKLFDDMTCQLLTRRARFQSALSSDGKSMVSYYTNKVRFIIP